MNLGVLGSGFIVNTFLNVLKGIDGYHLSAIWGRHEEKVKAFENDFDYYTTDLERILNDPQIDVIYVALPNSLHYSYSKKALLAGKHVFVEKPFCVTYAEAEELIQLGKEKNLLVFEGIMTKFAPNYIESKKVLDQLGDIKLIDGNFSQYSRRYDRFKEGIILPAFDYMLAGGALMDLGVYNIHYIVGMFGRPQTVSYFPNILNNVDTSGVLVLDYGRFKATLINAKDCGAPAYITVQGDKGYLKCNTTASRCGQIELVCRNGNNQLFNESDDCEFASASYEWIEFLQLFNTMDLKKCQQYNEETLDVQFVLEQAALSADLKMLKERNID